MKKKECLFLVIFCSFMPVQILPMKKIFNSKFLQMSNFVLPKKQQFVLQKRQCNFLAIDLGFRLKEDLQKVEDNVIDIKKAYDNLIKIKNLNSEIYKQLKNNIEKKLKNNQVNLSVIEMLAKESFPLSADFNTCNQFAEIYIRFKQCKDNVIDLEKVLQETK